MYASFMTEITCHIRLSLPSLCKLLIQMLIHMFVFYVVNKLWKNCSKIISRLQLKSLSSFSVSSYSVSISIYSDLIDLFLFIFVLFIFILPTSVLYICIYFERGKTSAQPHFNRVVCILRKCLLLWKKVIQGSK